MPSPTFTFVPADSYEALPHYKQVRAVCFAEDSSIVVIRERSDWVIPGGRIASGEQPEETLHGEMDEEASVTITQPYFIGYTRVTYPPRSSDSGGNTEYHLRYVALAQQIQEQTLDPAHNRTWERTWVMPDIFPQYVRWGDNGRAMLEAALTCFRCWQEYGVFAREEVTSTDEQ